ncbi:MAG: hypothetical protein ACYSYU_00025 [Planctomycetota bacterium]|jgi:hypothetical protein
MSFFPNDPTVGDTISVLGKTYQWTGTVWKVTGGSSFDGAFGSLTGTPTTIAGYGITDSPPLDDPTFTGTLNADIVSVGDGVDAILTADAANILAMRNGANANELRIYNTYTDASNYERLEVKWDTNEAFVSAAYNGTGSARNVVVGADRGAVRFEGASSIIRWYIGGSSGTNKLYLNSNGLTLYGDYLPQGDGTRNLGSSIARFANTHTYRITISSGVQERYSTIVGATGVVTHDCDNGHIFRHTSPAADFTANFTNLGLNDDYATTVSLVIEQGATAYIANAIQIEGVAQTINWQGGLAPSGTNNGVDIISFSILDLGSSYLVVGQLVDFA